MSKNSPIQAQNSEVILWRPYTTQDFIDQVPCFFIYRDEAIQVQPLSLGAAHPFDGSKLLTTKCGEEAFITRCIEGSDLTYRFYARKD